MPIYEPDHVEYTVSSSYISIVLDGGGSLPAYLAHPHLGLRFPGVALLHDWWGLTDMMRRLAHLFAQMGYYCIVPDLFKGQQATTPQQAMELVRDLGSDYGFDKIDSAMNVLENHHHTNGNVAAVGVGMGGSLAFEAAISRDDLEAAVAFGGFPDRCFGRFPRANTPILAFYGVHEPHITPKAIGRLRAELARNPIGHRVEIVDQMGHEFFAHGMTDQQRLRSRMVLKDTLNFLDGLLVKPQLPAYHRRQRY